ncbi:DUF4251 domain-containing protein [Winogradskyella sp.]|uniref:DUF4251 domain-containing protein n=1 Tax=Winogradskyella sp. TaxID=1883156 RepID=UPI002631A367|nr:DUF4251 domain-containing protein [Winogradskyella sp.]
MRIKIIPQNLIKVLIVGLLAFNFGCKSTDNMSLAEKSAQLATLETILNDQSYRVDIEAVYPFNTAATLQVLNQTLLPQTSNNASRIDVIDDGHFIEISNKTKAKGDLPFFGEQRLKGSHYSSSGHGILFDGKPENYKVVKNEKKSAWQITYRINDAREPSEIYDVELLVFPNNHVEINISPSLKTFIRYQGKLKVVEPTEEEI